jgi:hypothetical protein
VEKIPLEYGQSGLLDQVVGFTLCLVFRLPPMLDGPAFVCKAFWNFLGRITIGWYQQIRLLELNHIHGTCP